MVISNEKCSKHQKRPKKLLPFFVILLIFEYHADCYPTPDSPSILRFPRAWRLGCPAPPPAPIIEPGLNDPAQQPLHRPEGTAVDIGHAQTLKRFHVLFGGIALVPGQSIAGIVCIELNHLPVACHLAIMEAALMAGSLASPPTIVRTSQSSNGARLPSTSAKLGWVVNTAMASKLACRMLIRSISSGSARPRA
jgi:hypothetical protein